MTRTGGDLAYETLKALGVEHVFGLVSVHNIAIYDAIARSGGIRAIDMRHEQGAVHAADGYARATGKLGVAITSTGPGACNAVPGLFEAQFASSPVLMLTGQIDSPFYGRGKGFLHEAERQLEMLGTVTRKSVHVGATDDIATAIVEVASDIVRGRPQPGAVEIPCDFQYAETSAAVPVVPEPSTEMPSEDVIRQAADVIAGARKRVIWAGGGVVGGNAAGALTALAEALEAPVFTSANGRGAISEDHELAMGPSTAAAEMRPILEAAEVVIAVGTRFQAGATANWGLELPGRLVHIDADPSVIGRNYPAAVAVRGDAEASLTALEHALNAEPGDRDFLQAAQDARAATRAAIREQMGPDHQRIMDHIRASLPTGAPIVRDATVPAYIWGNRLLPIRSPRTSLHPTSAAIGPGLPLAIGAAVGSGEKTVVIQGDGGFQLSIGELATAAQYDLPIVICVFNDGGYGVLRMIQSMRFEGRTTGVDINTPDFAAVAEGMGLRGERVQGVDAFERAFSTALEATGPVLLDIDMASLAPMGSLLGGPPRRSA